MKREFGQVRKWEPPQYQTPRVAELREQVRRHEIGFRKARAELTSELQKLYRGNP